MPVVTLAGHPLHTTLNDAPMALLPFSLTLDLMHSATGKPAYAQAAYYGLMGATIGGAAAGIAGATDYLEIPSQSETKRVGNIHALLNMSLLGLMVVNLLLRRGRATPTGRLPLLLSALANLGIIISSWYGAEMVYTHGQRVRGVSPAADAPEADLPGDDVLEMTYRQTGDEIAPAAGPEV